MLSSRWVPGLPEPPARLEVKPLVIGHAARILGGLRPTAIITDLSYGKKVAARTRRVSVIAALLEV